VCSDDFLKIIIIWLIGSIIVSTLWEAKARYMLPYTALFFLYAMGYIIVRVYYLLLGRKAYGILPEISTDCVVLPR